MVGKDKVAPPVPWLGGVLGSLERGGSMSERGRRRVRVVGLAGGGLVALGLAVACNYHWYPFGTTFQLLDFEPLRLVSAVPAARGASGDFEPVCMGEREATGLILSLAVLGRLDQEAGGEMDLDLNMRPGDIVKTVGTTDRVVVAEGESIGPNNFKVTVECLERYPDSDMGGNRECQGLLNPGAAAGAAPASFRYSSDLSPQAGGYAYTRDLSTGYVGVAVLIDQSGSMKGFVDRATFADVSRNIPYAESAEGFASDLNGQRIVAVRDFLMKLNPADKAIVFQYGESLGTGAKVVCYDALGNTPEENLRERCYSTDRDLVLGQHVVQNKTFPPKLDELPNYPEGADRSPLWSAVADVYEFMKGRKDTPIRHILVVNDGPDTCDASSPDYRPYVGGKFQGVCSTTGYEEFRSRVLEDLKDPAAPRVHIHFVQFQAHGYLEHDLRQQEMACLTGGHYQFVNSIRPAKLVTGNDWTPLQTALSEALLRVRYSLVGVWRMAIELPDLGATLARGAPYSMKATITMVGAAGSLTSVDQFLYLRVGDQSASSLGTLDRRAMFRLPCAGALDCGWFQETAPECREAACVSPEAVCGFQAVADLQKCGTSGVCCNGWCAEGKTACQQ